MKKAIKTITLFLLVMGILVSVIGCTSGRDVGYNNHSYSDGAINEFEPVETTIDFSLYSDHGDFGDDGITWVEKSDYTGTKYGYIDRDGNFIMPLTDKIVKAENFHKGFAVIWYTCDLFSNGDCAIINTKCEVVATFKHHAITKRYRFDNGNMYLGESTSASMFCASTCEFVTVPLIDVIDTSPSIGYNEGLLLTYGCYPSTSGEKGVRYIDENGKIVLHLEKTNQYYRAIRGASIFSNGKATVFFIGQDRKLYKVTIDKTGKWLDEPVSARDDDVYWGRR